MLLETADIDRPNTTSFNEISGKRASQQSAKAKSKSTYIEVVIKAKPPELQPSNSSKSCKENPSGELMEVTEGHSKVLDSERDPGELEIVQTSVDARKTIPLATATASKSSVPDHSDPAPKVVPHSINSDKKARKQIRTIQQAIRQEIRSGRSKANSGILRGLKKALRKLTAARTHLDQSLSSPLEKGQILISYRENQAHAEKSPSQEPIRTIVLSASQQPPAEPGEGQANSDTLTLWGSFPILAPPSRQRSLAKAAEIEAFPSTANIEDTMAEEANINGEKSQEGRDLISTDHNMTGTDTNNAKFFPLTDDCHHYTRRSEVDWDIQKYWAQRYSIFSLYDEGIHMTDDSWFGVTPEPVANKIAEDLAHLTPPSKTVLIDMFAGAGGNVIAFALSKRWSTIIAIEKDPSVIACAQHNAEIYGVYEQITWINDDSFSYLEFNASSIDLPKAVIFASPPWGGPGYTSDQVFNLNTMSPYSMKQIHEACKGMDSALYLPRNSDLRQIAKLGSGGKKVEVVQYCMQGASKALVAYFPGTASITS